MDQHWSGANSNRHNHTGESGKWGHRKPSYRGQLNLPQWCQARGVVAHRSPADEYDGIEYEALPVMLVFPCRTTYLVESRYPVSVDLAVVAMELAADGLTSKSQPTWRPAAEPRCAPPTSFGGFR